MRIVKVLVFVGLVAAVVWLTCDNHKLRSAPGSVSQGDLPFTLERIDSQVITAYHPLEDWELWRGRDMRGRPLVPFMTVAVRDFKRYPEGSLVYIEDAPGSYVGVVGDTGNGDFDLDICLEDEIQVNAWGRRIGSVILVRWEKDDVERY